MTNLIADCKPFCDYGMKSEIFIPSNIYDEFYNIMNTIVMLLMMSDYKMSVLSSVPSETHYFKFMKNNQRAFTISFHHEADKHRSLLEVSISYHFHNDYQEMMKHKELFLNLFDNLGFLDDNIVSFESEKDLIDGLKVFTKLL